MKTVLNDIIKFFRRFWTIVGAWLMEMIVKYKFKNALLFAVAFGFWFLLKGAFWAHLGWATFYIWIGINVESIMTVYRDLKIKNNW